MDWTKALDLEQALKNIRQDFIGDWYRDPWGWPEIDLIELEGAAALGQRADASGIRRVANIDVPKENFGTRPAVVLEPLDRLLYQALTDRLSKRLIGELPSWVFGWRLQRKSPTAGAMARNDFEWIMQSAKLGLYVGVFEYGFKTDIVSCFASMPVELVSEEIERRAGDSPVVTRLTDLLRGWEASPNRRGLPQRSAASAVLANMYLGVVDEVIDDYSASLVSRVQFKGMKSASTRWMDDVWVFGPDEGRLRRLQVDLQHAARGANLELNSAKTALLEGEALAEEALKVNHSAVEDGLIKDPGPDLEPLEELIDGIVASPESSDRTTIHFALVRMRRFDVKGRLPALVDVAPRMPHGSDHLARAFRDFGTWRDLVGWYVDHVKSDWGSFDWSTAQLCTMFPSRSRQGEAMVNALMDVLERRPQLPLQAVALQRLIKWAPDPLRDFVRDKADKWDHPLERRLLGLTSVALTEPRPRIRSLLGAYEENNITLRAIANRGFRPIPVVADFA
jgi:hypothetical protein